MKGIRKVRCYLQVSVDGAKVTKRKSKRVTVCYIYWAANNAKLTLPQMGFMYCDYLVIFSLKDFPTHAFGIIYITLFFSPYRRARHIQMNNYSLCSILSTGEVTGDVIHHIFPIYGGVVAMLVFLIFLEFSMWHTIHRILTFSATSLVKCLVTLLGVMFSSLPNE